MGITARELSEKLGLSTAAVSMALNNKPGVSTETRRRVLDAAEQYGYDMTRLSGRERKAKTVSFLVYKRHGAIVTDSAFFSELFDGVSEGCREEGFNLNIQYIYDDGASFDRQLESVGSVDPAGILLLGTELSKERFSAFSLLRGPLILLDTYFENIAANYVLINNVRGAYLAADYLIKTTHQQPGYLKSSYPIANFMERADGFYDAIRASGMSPSRCVVHELSPSIEGACADLSALLEAGEIPAPCYFADNDLIAIGAIKAFRAHGYDVPGDIKLVGFDNISMGSIVEPALTTIHVPKKEFGRAAVYRLSEILSHGHDVPMKIELSTSLICRKSA